MVKTNPKKIPRTQVDVDRAYQKGINDGVSNCCAIVLTVLLDKFNGADYISDVWGEINKLSEEVIEGMVSIHDLRRVLLEEYQIRV